MATPTADRPTAAEEKPLLPQAVSRRTFLRGGLSGTVAAGVASGVSAQGQTQQAGAAGAADHVLRDDLLALVNRITQGYSNESYAEAEALGFEGYLEWQLDHENIDDSEMDATLAPYATLDLTSKEIWDTYGPPAGETGDIPVLELRSADVWRGLLSRRQLYERMVSFWSDHFNAPHAELFIRFIKTAENRDVIRAHALGNFRDLLHADAKCAAMLRYLNNDTNVVGNPNENYAREVMELHTLGVDGPYNEHDIQELARCFTGWSYFPPQNPNFGNFRFREQVHDYGRKTVLGQVIAAGGGVTDAEFVLDFLAAHPTTAQFLARKLSGWLLCYEPPQSLVDQVAQAYLDTGGDIKSMIRVILSPAAFAQHHPAGNPKLRRPEHLLASIVRATGATVTATNGLMSGLTAMAHVPFHWPSPDGYPDSVAAWGNTLLPRWDFATRFFANQVPGVNLAVPQLIALVEGASPSGLARSISDVLMGGAMSAQDVTEVQAFIDSVPNVTVPVLREAFALAVSSPSFQYY